MRRLIENFLDWAEPMRQLRLEQEAAARQQEAKVMASAEDSYQNYINPLAHEQTK